MFDKLHIDHLVVVTGPTSSGKSTLQELIMDDKIHGEIRSVVPEDISSWTHLCHREYDGSLDTTKEKPVNGLVLHYDMMRPFKKFKDGYEDDVISELLESANKTTVLIIKPEREVLLEQLKSGELDGSEVKSLPKGLSFRKFVSRTLQLIPSGIRNFIKKRIFPNRKTAVTDFNEVLYFKYQEEGWLDTWYQNFDRYLEDRKQSGLKINRYFIRSSRDDMTKWEVLP